MTADEVHKARLAAQGLATRPARDAAEVAERLLAIQGQDPRGARLAVQRHLPPFALVKGRAVATWRLPKGEVEIEHLENVTKKATNELEADGQAVESYLSK